MTEIRSVKCVDDCEHDFSCFREKNNFEDIFEFFLIFEKSQNAIVLCYYSSVKWVFCVDFDIDEKKIFNFFRVRETKRESLS